MLQRAVQGLKAKSLIEVIRPGWVVAVDSEHGVIPPELTEAFTGCLDQGRGNAPLAIAGVRPELIDDPVEPSCHLLIVGKVGIETGSDHLVVG